MKHRDKEIKGGKSKIILTKINYFLKYRKYGRTYINILHDPRVVRGNTYAAFVIPSSLQMEFIRLKEEEQRRKRLMNIPKRLPVIKLSYSIKINFY